MDLVRIEREGLQLEQGLGGVFLEWDFDLDGGLAVQAKNREPMIGVAARRNHPVAPGLPSGRACPS